MSSTGKSNPNTPQICLSAPPAPEHCFSAQAGLGESSAHLPEQFLSPLTATLCPMCTSKGIHGHCQSPHRGESSPSLCWLLWAGKGWFWGFCCLHQHAKKCWEEPVFLYRKLHECVSLTSWVLRCRSSLIPSENPAVVTNQQMVLLLTFYLMESQVSQGRLLSKTTSLPSITPQVTSIAWHASVSEEQKSHTDVQALKNNQHVSATEGKAPA